VSSPELLRAGSGPLMLRMSSMMETPRLAVRLTATTPVDAVTSEPSTPVDSTTTHGVFIVHFNATHD